MGKYVLHPYKGEMLTLEQISERCGVNKQTLHSRIKNHGCTAEEAASMEMRVIRTYPWTDGRSLTIREISAITGIKQNTIESRMRAGVPFLDACTQKFCPRRKYDLDTAPRLSDEEKYMEDGQRNQRVAKSVCKAMLGIDPRKVGLREVNYWLYLFDTDSVAFEIEIRRAAATCTGKMKSNGNTLIQRKYRIIEDKIREVTYG